MDYLNLGVLAHVDAGKTTLTERLLFTVGVLDRVGSVDQGTTQTDTLALERQRGITIRAAVVAFVVDDVTVNLIDTPGHPDFIAEVDRSLAVLDGAVLVVSAVEGVQSQTVVLMRALRRLGVPTLVFVNKIDRTGADPEQVLVRLRERLGLDAVPMGTTRDVGGPAARFQPYPSDDPAFLGALTDTLVEHDSRLLTAILDDEPAAASPAALHRALAVQTAAGLVHPAFFGSAATGAGVAELLAQLPQLLPRAPRCDAATGTGTVFKVERERGGQQVAYVRMRSGALHLRDRLSLRGHLDDHLHRATITSIRVYGHGGVTEESEVTAGQIAQLRGLRGIRVGDTIGPASEPGASATPGATFAPPTLETAVVARDPDRQSDLYAALTELAEQDPLINLRQDDARHELFLSLYGEVQQEVIRDTLAMDFGLEVDYRETTTLCIERVAGVGEAVEVLGDPDNPFMATVGLRVEPGPRDTGLRFELDVELASLPLYVYRSVDAFRDAMSGYVGNTLRQGLSGWEVTDCRVTLTTCGYSPPSSTAADYRKLVPLVLMGALQRAATVVCEPVSRFHLEAPADTLSAVLALLARHRAVPEAPQTRGDWTWVEGDVPTDAVQRLQQQLRGRTHGEGGMEVAFDRYEPGFGPAPTRPRSDDNPLNRKEYLSHVLGRV